jgi:hypothetical protein
MIGSENGEKKIRNKKHVVGNRLSKTLITGRTIEMYQSTVSKYQKTKKKMVWIKERR